MQYGSPRESAFTVGSAEETRRLGRTLAARLRPGDLLCLRGELGTGKTTLVQGLAEGLQVAEPATSPSFTFVHEHRGRLLLYHVDLYRIGPRDLGDIGIDEILGGCAVVAVEWADRLPSSLCREALTIEMAFDRAEEDARRVRMLACGDRARRILEGLAEEFHARPCT